MVEVATRFNLPMASANSDLGQEDGFTKLPGLLRFIVPRTSGHFLASSGYECMVSAATQAELVASGTAFLPITREKGGWKRV